MKRKLLKTIELLTDSMVPDNYEEIINKTTGVNIIKKKRNNFKVWKLATAIACCTVIAVTTFSVINFDNSINPPVNTNKETTLSTPRDADNVLTDKLSTNNIFFNNFAIYTTKIGGIRKKAELSELKKTYPIDNLPNETKCYFLCEDTTTPNSEAFAGNIVYETDDVWFSCLISKKEIIEPLNEKIQFSYLNNNKLILSKCEEHYYATFESKGLYFAIEAEGYSDEGFLDMIKSLMA